MVEAFANTLIRSNAELKILKKLQYHAWVRETKNHSVENFHTGHKKKIAIADIKILPFTLKKSPSVFLNYYFSANIGMSGINVVFILGCMIFIFL